MTDDETPEEDPTKLKRQLGLVDGIAIIVGVIIGCGIFITPTSVLEYSGSIGQSIIVWSLCGVLSMIGALCFAELGTMIPKSGGEYVYLTEAFGSLVGFLYLWARLFIVVPSDNAVRCLMFALYTIKVVDSIGYFGYIDDSNTSDDPKPINDGTKGLSVKLTAVAVVLIVTAINCYNVKLVANVQRFFSSAKVLALILIIGAGAIYLMSGHNENLQSIFQDTVLDAKSITLAFYAGFYTYSGWTSLNCVTEELKDPNRNLPRALYISLALVTVIYTLTNLAYFIVLTKSEIIGSPAVAETFGNRIHTAFAFTVPIFVACSAFGALNANLLSMSRLIYVAAGEGHLPKILSSINVRRSTPIPALIFLCVLTLVALLVDDINVLIIHSSFIETLIQTTCVLGQIFLRVKDPRFENRAIKINMAVPILFFVISGVFFVVSCCTSPKSVGVGIGILAVGAVVYFVKESGVIQGAVGRVRTFYRSVPLHE